MEFKDFKQLEKLIKPKSIRNISFFRPVKGFSIDSRKIKRGQGFIAIIGRHKDGHDFIQQSVSNGAAFVIAQNYRSIKKKVPFFLVDDTYAALFTICKHIRKKVRPTVIAVTGSVGKSITKEMLSFILQEHFTVLKNEKTENNFLGVGKTMLNLDKQKIMILEFGTNSRGEIETLANMSLPDIGVITFIKPVHLAGLKNLEGICDEKLSLFKASKKMKAVLNKDDAYLSRSRLANETFWFGKDSSNDLYASLVKREDTQVKYLIQGKNKLVLSLSQENFLTNIQAALLTAKLLNIPLKLSVDRINDFKNSLSMRMQTKVGQRALIINDAYNANPYSCQQGLRTIARFDSKKIAVLGDMLELGERGVYYHKLLAKEFIKNDIDYCLTYGPLMKHLKDELVCAGYNRAYHFKTHKAIADFINKKINSRNRPKKAYLVFLKGSRRMKLEKVIDYIKL